MTQSETWELPHGWASATLSELVDAFESGGRPKGGAKGVTEGVPSLGGEHLVWTGGFDFREIRYVPRSYYERMNRGKVRRHDVLLVKDGATTGKAAFVGDDFPFDEAAVNEHVFLLRFSELFLHPKYVFYWLQSQFGQQCVRDNFQGTAQGGITQAFARNAALPLAPLLEQHRIVAEIEAQFTRLDAAVAALKRVQARLRRYKSSVLKAACEGRLVPTEAELARAEGRDYEPAGVLLKRILADRRAKSEAQHPGKRYQEPQPPDTSALPEPPEGWVWASVQQLTLMMQYGTSERADADSLGLPVLRMGNVQDGRLVFRDLKYYPRDWPEWDKFVLEGGDVLFNRTNSAELVGKSAVYRAHHRPAAFASYLIRLRANPGVLPDLLSHVINSAHGRGYIASVVSQQVGQANVSGAKLARMPIPFPPCAEQHRIVAELDRRLSVVQELEGQVEAALRRAERLRQSILKTAFEGRLVPQDPSDEPAGGLLERIRAAREAGKRGRTAGGPQSRAVRGTQPPLFPPTEA